MLYADESQEVAVRGEEPPRSRFRPARRLSLVRVTIAGTPIYARFDGSRCTRRSSAADGATDQWPQDGAIFQVPWDEL